MINYQKEKENSEDSLKENNKINQTKSDIG